MIVENLLPFMLVAAILFGLLWLVVGAWTALGDLVTGRARRTRR